MENSIDIRDQEHLSSREVLRLNFIRSQEDYFFRKYYRAGLRSHIFELLNNEDVELETSGEMVNGIRKFPRAKPKMMLRIFRSRFETIEQVMVDVRKYHLLLKLFGSRFIATSEEFVVEYTGPGTSQIVLCGLQEYIEGEILDPWSLESKNYLADRFICMQGRPEEKIDWVRALEKQIAAFVSCTRQLIFERGFVPDLSGIGNLIVTAEAGVKLVDINNIVEVRLDDKILIDDKGYPACDKSVEALSILEGLGTGKQSLQDPLYKHFLSPERMKAVKAFEKRFYKSL